MSKKILNKVMIAIPSFDTKIHLETISSIISTRDIWVSFILTCMFIILVSGIFNENSNYCIIPKKYLTNNPISKLEYEVARKTIQLYESQKKKKIN